MATRFYLHSSGSQPAPTNPAFNAGWEQTAAATRLPMDVSKQLRVATALTTSGNITVPITTTQQILSYQFTSRQVFRPTRFDTSVQFSGVLRCSENATTNNVTICYSLRAVSPDGGTFLGTIKDALSAGASEYALHASQQTRIVAAASIIAALTILQPFRLVLEIGSHAAPPSAAGNFQHRIGCNAASDFALTTALTTNLNPWFELSSNIGATTIRNFHDLTMGKG